MAVIEPIDWLQSTNEERKRLYKAAKPLRDNLRIKTWNDFFEPILSVPRAYGHDYGANFKNGKISRPNAMEVYNWIVANHLEKGRRLAPDLFPASLLTPWDGFISKFGQYDSFGTDNPTALGLSQRDSDSPISDEPIHFKEPYCFNLKSKIEGCTLALESHEHDEWHPVALGETEKHLSCTCSIGNQFMPMNNETGQPEILREYHDAGIRRFILLVANQEHIDKAEAKLFPKQYAHQSTLNEIAFLFKDVPTHEYAVHRLNVVFLKN